MMSRIRNELRGPSLDNDSRIGSRIKRTRNALGLTLRQVSERSGVPLSTISKVEKGQKTSVDTLVKVARGLGVLFDVLLHDASPSEVPGGRRTVDSADTVSVYETELYRYDVHASALMQKAMFPLIITVKTPDVPPRGDWSTHAGEEFVYVLSGAIDLHTEFYAPKRLNTGESAYFDSKMRHAYVSVSDENAVVISVSTQGLLTSAGSEQYQPARSSPLSDEVSGQDK